MDEFREQVRKGFSKCKSDIDDIQIENSRLKKQVSKIEEENSSLKSEMSEMKEYMIELKAEMKGVKIALDYIKEFNSNNNVKTNSIVENNVQEKIVEADAPKVKPKKEEVYVPPITDPYEALLAFKAKTNKREFLKQKLMQMVSENGMQLSELKFLFVDHFRYCSKATFYNYLKEMELEKQIRIERESSKNYVYLSGMLTEKNFGR